MAVCNVSVTLPVAVETSFLWLKCLVLGNLLFISEMRITDKLSGCYLPGTLGWTAYAFTGALGKEVSATTKCALHQLTFKWLFR